MELSPALQRKLESRMLYHRKMYLEAKNKKLRKHHYEEYRKYCAKLGIPT